MRRFEGKRIRNSSLNDLCAAIGDYEVMLVTILDAILERFERDPAYPFIDTKLNIITGEDFPEAEDPSEDFKGRTAIFGWIQGRGLEALAGHARWLPSCSVLMEGERRGRVGRLTSMVEQVLQRMEEIRMRNGGRLHFLTTPDGASFRVENGRRHFVATAVGPLALSDLFYSKGMLAAAALLGRREKMNAAIEYFRMVTDAVGQDRLVNDQLSFDPKNTIEATARKRGHAFRMVGIGGCALFTELLGDGEWRAAGTEFIRHILDCHVNHGQFPSLQQFDFLENIDGDGGPWMDGQGRILSDPGHALEFVGLAAKQLLLVERSGTMSSAERELLPRCKEMFPDILLRSFDNGYNPAVGGICKCVDLVSRSPVNSDMPWWSLPETMRAAAELLILCPGHKRAPEIRRVIADCSNAFLKNYVNPKVHLMAYQTLAPDGQPVDVIPATPDADPGYHTGLSVIDFLNCLGTLAKIKK